ncbi:hypothetical protein RUM43_002375, partial [Polyplax serrata]
MENSAWGSPPEQNGLTGPLRFISGGTTSKSEKFYEALVKQGDVADLKPLLPLR